jgi:prolyl-tRNA synthetase
LVKALAGKTVFGERLRVLLDTRPQKSAEKRWNWVRRGAPLIVEIGPRDAAGGNVTFMRRDVLRDGDKVRSQMLPMAEFVDAAPALLEAIQKALYDEAKARLDDNIRRDIASFEALADYFGPPTEDDEAGGAFKGWVRAPWSRPQGEGLEAVEARLKALKLTLRNVPMDQPATFGPCIFTGARGVEEILIARAY